jgi:cell division protease FtsH
VRSGFVKNSFIYLLIVAAVIALVLSVFNNQPTSQELDISDLAIQIRQDNVKSIVIKEDDSLVIEYQDDKEELSRKEPGVSFFKTMQSLGVPDSTLAQIDIAVEPRNPWSNWLALGITVLPLIIFGGLLFFMLRQAQGSNSQAMSFGRSKAKMFTGDKPTVTFDDVAGADEAKEELSEVVDFLREPEKFISLGARIPKGVLMVGPPGCGKTLLAKAVSGEAGVPFFSISGSEFVEMFVGVGASRVRDLFEQAKRNSPCIIFVDEIDAVGRHRGAGLGGSHDEREQTLNQILVEMDGFGTDTNVIVIAATNRPDILDPALLRPGRFDRRVVLDRPDWRGREKILEVHVRGKPLSSDVNLNALAKMTVGFVGADLENLVNEAAILAARKNQRQISASNFQEALEKVVMGPERKSKVLNKEERKIIAYREAGQAIVAKMSPESDPIHKISIVSRGGQTGRIMHLPSDDQTLPSQTRFKTMLRIFLGGRAAEEIIFPHLSNSSYKDLEDATKLARTMVTQYGMSQEMGPIIYGKKEELVFLGKEIGEQRNYSEEAARAIDLEVRRFIDEAYVSAKRILTEHRDKLAEVAERLIAEETIDGPTFNAMFA